MLIDIDITPVSSLRETRVCLAKKIPVKIARTFLYNQFFLFQSWLWNQWCLFCGNLLGVFYNPANLITFFNLCTNLYDFPSDVQKSS